MDKEAFLKVVNNVKEITDNDLEDLLESSKFYPYCQNIHILIAKKYHDLQHGLAPAKLHKAAIYTPDRLFLKRIMEDDPTRIKASRPSQHGPSKVTNGPEISNAIEAEAYETPDNLVQDPEELFEPGYQDKMVQPDEDIVHQSHTTTEAFNNPIQTEEPDKQETVNLASGTIENLPTQKVEVFGEKEDIRAELARNIKEYKERSIQKDKSHETNNEAPQQEKPEITGPTPKDAEVEQSINEPKHELSNIEQAGDYAGIVDAEKQTSGSDKDQEVDQHQLIENFIKLNPSLSRFDLKFNEDQKQIEDLSIPKLTIGEHLISENLAVILNNQGKSQKAINIYEKLILKFPEKKAYFASCIEEIKNS
ncbi:MAG: hypothetical protein M3512_00675 [Bacteroidota bacterium]|nr:hypothetical protein [Bacteroidota bacterium]